MGGVPPGDAAKHPLTHRTATQNNKKSICSNISVMSRLRTLDYGDVFIFYSACCACVKLLQSCLTLCNPMDCSLPGFSVSGLPCPPPGDLPQCRDQTHFILSEMQTQAPYSPFLPQFRTIILHPSVTSNSNMWSTLPKASLAAYYTIHIVTLSFGV